MQLEYENERLTMEQEFMEELEAREQEIREQYEGRRTTDNTDHAPHPSFLTAPLAYFGVAGQKQTSFRSPTRSSAKNV